MPTSDHDRRNTTIKDVSVDNAEELRKDALRLVQEGVVHLEEGTHAAYERQGNMAFYSEENLAQRLAIRNHPLLKRLTCALWRLVCRGSHLMDYEGYSEVMIRLHKILMEHFNTRESYARIRQDWESDARGEDLMHYDAFHLSMFELVDLWCDSIQVKDYISLLYLILEGITRVVNARFVLRPLDEILYTDVVDSALQKSIDDIELIMSTMQEEPLEDEPPSVEVPKIVETQEPIEQPAEPIEVPQVVVIQEKQKQRQRSLSPPSPSKPTESPVKASPPRKKSIDKTPKAQSTAEPRPKAVEAAPPQIQRRASFKKPTQPEIQVLEQPRPAPVAAMEKPRRKVSETLSPCSSEDPLPSAITPWEDTVEVVPPAKVVEKPAQVAVASSSPTRTRSVVVLAQESRSKSDRRMDVSITQPKKQEGSNTDTPTPPPVIPVAAKYQKEAVPLESRDFGGFSIMSPRDMPQSYQTQVQVSAPRYSAESIKLMTAHIQKAPSSSRRQADIERELGEKRKQSFVRKRTPPSLGITESKPRKQAPQPPQSEAKKMSKKAEAFHQESVSLVTELASSTLGTVIERPLSSKQSVRPPSTRTSLRAADPSSFFPFTSAATTEDGAPLLHIGLSSLPRPTGAPKNMLPRRLRVESLAKKLAETTQLPTGEPTEDTLHVEKLASPRLPAAAHINDSPRLLPKLPVRAEAEERPNVDKSLEFSPFTFNEHANVPREPAPHGPMLAKLAPPMPLRSFFAESPSEKPPDPLVPRRPLVLQGEKAAPTKEGLAVGSMTRPSPPKQKNKHYEALKFNVLAPPPLPSTTDFVTIQRVKPI